MSPKMEQLIKQFLSLNSAEQQELLHLIHKLGNGNGVGIERRGGDFLGESTTINFAPTPGRCPRCGK